MGSRVEVSFNPHGGSEEWPHFLAAVGDRANVEYLYELLADGWFCTMRAGGPGGYSVGAPKAIKDPDLGEKLWAGAARLTEEPDAEAFILRFGATTWEPFNQGSTAPEHPQGKGGEGE